MTQMTRTHKLLLGIAAAMFLLVGGMAYAVQQVVVHQGLLSIDVVEKDPAGCRVSLVIPAVLLNLGTSAMPLVIPDEDRARMRDELVRYEPVIRTMLAEFEHAPDMTFVEVQSEHEYVSIRKRDGHLVIDVDTNDENVHVAMPVASLEHAWDTIHED